MQKNNFKRIRIQYYASLREASGRNEEWIKTRAQTPQELFQEIKKQRHLNISPQTLKVAINDEFCAWDSSLKPNDTVIFIPPVAGG